MKKEMSILKIAKQISLLFFVLGFLVFFSFRTNGRLTSQVVAGGTVSAAAVFPAGYPDVKINEVYYHAGAEQEQIELYNSSFRFADLATCTIEDNSAHPLSLAGKTIDDYGYLVLTKGVDFTFSLSDTSDLLIFKCGGLEIDRVVWGGGGLNAPAVALGKTISRIANGYDTNIDANDFKITNKTLGSTNIYP